MNNAQSLLEDFRRKSVKDYEQQIDNAPPISAALLSHVESMFVAPEVSPNDPQLKNKLVFQHGIERVLKYMRGLHDRQEKDIKARYNRE